MLLKFCNDNFLFYITHTKYFDILCCFVILFLIFLIFLSFNDKFINKIKNNKFKMIFIIAFLGLFVGFLLFLFACILNKDAFNGCSTKFYENIYFRAKNDLNKKAAELNKSKVIVVGDSRMEFIADDKDIVIPFNFEFVAKSGMKIDWFRKTAIPKVKSILKNKEYKYYVIVNMGVNDLNTNYKGDEISKDYFKLYQKLAKDYPNIDVYIMSVNPIYEDKLNKSEVSNKRTVNKIKLFNNNILNELEHSNLDNLYYCDSYNNLHFESEDGLHYTRDTNKEIINYIANKCIDFK